jgi:uncharacterized protein YqeY
MMSIKEKLEEELKEALKENDIFKKDALRFLMAAIKNKEIEKRGSGKGEILTDEEVIDLFRKEFKKRKEAANIYKENGRLDLFEKEEKEAAIIQSFLPRELSDEEIENVVLEVIKKTNSSSLKDLGKVIKESLNILKDKASPARVSEIAKKKLS